MKPVHLASSALVILAIAISVGLKVGDPPGKQMHTFADSFLSTLDETQLAAATMPYDAKERSDWHFIPKKTRKGLMMREMNDAQRTAALRLLRSAVSEIGYVKADQIRGLESVLFELEGEDRNWARDPLMYYVTIFGEPSDEDAWGLSFEGHHLSLNFVCRGGKVVDSTPQFMAANPATVMNEVSGPLKKGTRVLRDEEQLAFDLVQALNPGQSALAITAEEAPAEIRFAGEPQASVGEAEGIPYGELNESQQAILRELVSTYVEIAPPSVAQNRMKIIKNDGWENMHFAWAGATKPGVGHYYRVQSPSFLIEFVNKQPDAAGNPANHIHCVWRDLTGDFDLSPGS